MKTKLLLLGLALALALFPGCASVGHEMNLTQTQQIKKGETTLAQMEQLFGQPASVSRLPNGTTTAMWFYSKASNTARNFIPIVNLVSMKIDTKNQVLSVSFDEQGRVENYSFTQGGMPINAGLIK